MAPQVMTEQVGVRFGIGTGVLFGLTTVVVAGRLHGAYGVALLLLATALLAATLDRAHGLVLGLSGWGFATGFAVHSVGVLTFAPSDLARLAVFLVAALATSRPGGER